MKIPLNMGQGQTPTNKEAQRQALERDLSAAKKDDWNAKRSITRTFKPLLTSLAEKRSTDPAEVNRLIEAGQQGLFKAVKKFKIKDGADKFRLFSLDYIEKGMDGGGGGFLSKLFGG